MLNHLTAKIESLGLGQEDRIAQTAAASFDISIWQLLAGLLVGGRVEILEGAEAYEPRALMKAVNERGITVLEVVPSVLRPLVEEIEQRKEGLSGLKRLLVTGERLGAEECRRWLNEHPGRELINAYGPTECSDDVTQEVVGEAPPAVASEVAIGRPLRNTRIYIVDSQWGLAPIGVEGEICVGGKGVGRGYYQEFAQTAESFIPDRYGPEAGGRLYRTGDRGRSRSDGKIEFLGRIDDQVKLRGHRIELGEIEAVLEAHPLVEEAAVMVGAEGSLVGYVKGKGAWEEELLQSYLRERLPEYMTPGVWVRMERMPLTANGKLDRKALPPPSVKAAKESEEPRTAVEEIVAGVWAEVLKRERVGVDENFFELGGHSLLATQVVSRVREAFNVEVALREIFERPTVRGLAEAVERERGAGRMIEAPPIRPVEREGELPLSFAQQRLWFIQQLEPESGAYNIPTAVRLRGALDLAALRQSLMEIARRHETLRTRFVSREGQPVQVIDEVVKAELPLWDLGGLRPEESEGRAREIAAQEAIRPFDLERGPVWRAGVVRVGGEEHVLLLSLHHVASDGWSMGILVRELTELYGSYREGGRAKLAELEAQYADFALWQRQWLRGAALDAQLSYWKRRLAGAGVLELPTDRPRPAAASYRGALQPLRFSAELTEGIRELSRREGVTVFMTLLGAFQTTLSRYAGEEDVVVGTDVANRNRYETEGLIGFFVNQLVLRTDLSGRPSVRELLGRVRETALGAYAHQDVPFEKLVEELSPERDLGRSPLFQVKLVLQNAPRAEVGPLGVAMSRFGLDHASAKFDLTLVLHDGQERLSGAVEYATDLYDAVSIERLIGHLGRVLEAMAQGAPRRIGEIDLLTPGERRQIEAEWNDTALERDPIRGVHELFRQQAEHRADAVAMVSEAEHLSYAKLDQLSGRLANYLIDVGVSLEVKVALCLERSPEMVMAVLGVLKAGGAYVPLDPRAPAERLAYLLEDAQAPLLLTQSHLRSRLPTTWIVQCLDLDQEWETIESYPAEVASREIPAECAAYLIYTSGSTGRPKGVVLTHSGMTNLALAVTAPLGVFEGTAQLQFSSPSFDASVWEYTTALIAGAKLVFGGRGEVLAGERLQELLESEQVEVATIPPSVLASVPPLEGGALRTLVVAGEACPESLAARWAEGRRMLDAYGPTETTVCATITPGLSAEEAPTIGRPIANVNVYVRSGCGELTPIGVAGELSVGGMGVGRGYWNRAELTAERFVPDGYGAEPGGRLYRTGDKVMWRADGELEYLGRFDNQIKLRGYRIELGEVESVLSELISIKEAVVVADENFEGKRLIAYIVPAEERGSKSALINEIRDDLRRRLPEYMIPAACVLLGELPLTLSGKVDRRALPPLEISPATPTAAYIPPNTDMERVISDVWQEVLQLERVGVHDNFFDLGGHSLLLVQVLGKLKEKVDSPISLIELFRYPTIHLLSTYLMGSKGDGETLVPAISK
jgi:amino acid adenylation domain-containing protein